MARKTVDEGVDELKQETVLLSIKSDVYAAQDGILTDRHYTSGDNYEPQDAFNQIGGIIMPFGLNGWLRHGCESVLIAKGQTVCHPSEEKANLQKKDVYERDLKAGYHPKGTCANKDGTGGCLIFQMFGGFENKPSVFMRTPIRFSPIRAGLDFAKGQTEGHYRRVVRQIASRNEEDGREPFRAMKIDTVSNIEGTWRLKFRSFKPQYMGLLLEAVDYLNEHRETFMHQLGGNRNFGGGIMEISVINPSYTDEEVNRLFDRSKGDSRKNKEMKQKDEQWEKLTKVYKDELAKAIKG